MNTRVGIVIAAFALVGCATSSSNRQGTARSTADRTCTRAVLEEARSAGRVCVEPAVVGTARANDCGQKLKAEGFKDAVSMAREMGKKTGKVMMCWGR